MYLGLPTILEVMSTIIITIQTNSAERVDASVAVGEVLSVQVTTEVRTRRLYLYFLETDLDDTDCLVYTSGSLEHGNANVLCHVPSTQILRRRVQDPHVKVGLSSEQCWQPLRVHGHDPDGTYTRISVGVLSVCGL